MKANLNIAIIDNYDSFTYNLVHAVNKLTIRPATVFRNDELRPEELESFDKIILSPGPGIPEEAGLLLDIIRHYAPRKSLLGVCLGHQAIAEVFGARLLNMSRVLHGISSPVSQTSPDPVLYRNVPREFEAGRYHSWTVDPGSLPDCLEVTGTDAEGQIMSIRHRQYDVRGLQFHPESVLTPLGGMIIKNWLYADSARPEKAPHPGPSVDQYAVWQTKPEPMKKKEAKP